MLANVMPARQEREASDKCKAVPLVAAQTKARSKQRRKRKTVFEYFFDATESFVSETVASAGAPGSPVIGAN